MTIGLIRRHEDISLMRCISVVMYEWIAAAVHSFYVAMHPKKAAGGRFIGMERVYDGGALQLAN